MLIYMESINTGYVVQFICLIIVVSITYWLYVGGINVFPNINPIIISLIIGIVVYIATKGRLAMLMY